MLHEKPYILLLSCFLGDTEQGRSHVKVAKAMNIVGPILTAVSVIIGVVYAVVAASYVASSAYNAYSSYSYSSNGYNSYYY